MINGNCQNRTVVKHGMMFCCLLCVTTGMLDFLLAMTFSSLFVTAHPSHGLPVFYLYVLSLSLGLGHQSLGLGLETAESWSWY